MKSKRKAFPGTYRRTAGSLGALQRSALLTEVGRFSPAALNSTGVDSDKEK